MAAHGIGTATNEPTATTTPTATQAVDAVEQLLASYLAGESIDVSSLSPAEFREFSTQLAEQRNAERGLIQLFITMKLISAQKTTR